MKHLGTGGFGSVFLAERRSDKKKFAAKKQKRTNPADFKNFLAELRMLQKMDHPNIVRLEESFANEQKNELVIILEYCPCKFTFAS